MSLNYIVMADVVGSRSYAGDMLMTEFNRVVQECNNANQAGLLSPLTITLGDEFQGVAASLTSAIDLILFLEDQILTVQPPFFLRYVLVHGIIETPINRVIAHGMAGPGLAMAREMLTQKRRRPRFQLRLDDCPYAKELAMLFRLLELLSLQWKQKDRSLIKELLKNSDDAAVGKLFGKTMSQIWKRRKTLQIEEYMTVKMLLKQMVNHCEGV